MIFVNGWENTTYNVLVFYSECSDCIECYVRFDDSASQSSGDSVLIGVEDQKDFKDYRDRSQVNYFVTLTLFGMA